jgi:site-specific recombinase XerD
MTASSIPTFPQLVQDYFCRYLIQQKNASQQTVTSYRDAVRLLLNFLKDELGREPCQLTLSDLSAHNIERFLNWLEEKRKNTVRTRNTRFAAIRSFLRYAGARDPGRLSFVQQVLAIPMKRFDRPLMPYLLREEIQAVLDAPDPATWSGRRDRAMFTVDCQRPSTENSATPRARRVPGRDRGLPVQSTRARCPAFGCDLSGAL